MSCPAAAEGEWELVGGMQKLDLSSSSVALQRPAPGDEHFLRSPMPGLAPEVRLFRCTVTPRLASPPVDVLHVHTDVVITDASGSTRMSLQGGGHSLLGGGGGRTVRSELNRQEERRFLRRLESIPLLVQSGVLRAQDVWRQVFCAFDHSVREYWSFECRAGDVSAELVRAVQSLAQGSGGTLQGRRGELGAVQAGAAQLLDSVVKTLETLRRLEPGGATSFQVAADHVASCYAEEVQAHVRAHPKLWKTAFVNWDTDGGNNRGSCYQAVRQLRERADVVGGFVMGIGAWVDQECAMRLAKILRGPCVLSLDFPPEDAQDAIFRRDLHHWLQAMKTMPLTATVSAGSVPWEARHGTRWENAVDCLAAVLPGSSVGSDAQQPSFELPDVSEMDHTKAALKGLSAGQPVVLYLMSRLPFDELARRLRVDFSTGGPAAVACADEHASGTMLAHDWMQVLSGRGCAVQRNSHSLVPRVQQLLEDSLSFNFNLPSASGSTARLGRAKTDHRTPVPSERQPKEPSINLTVEHGEAMDAPDESDDDGCVVAKPRRSAKNVMFGGFGAVSQPQHGGLFGAAPLSQPQQQQGRAPISPAAACAAAPMSRGIVPGSRGGAATGSGPFGAATGVGLFGGAAPGGFGGAAPQGGGLFGGAAPGGFGSGLFGGAARGQGGKEAAVARSGPSSAAITRRGR
ncbi:unnamed protein product [Prorocentrum cordatum]|uniref:Uncharacterized protein n=1 Tax=Prorocentrum cordatum TaxID=2364126 RepID=A0ABN9PFH9_9DINO|nr:unnamed protein product [Polarella glacialis]